MSARKRILVDRHHADLLYSLQLLFEDRLGVDVWVPVGYDWWNEGFWQFGRAFGDDRLARQYLNPDMYHNSGDGFYHTTDRCQPTRTIHGISLAAAKEMTWDFTMPSVQENQEGYARFAEACGARYLYQVGNHGQWVDESLEPTILTNVPMPNHPRAVLLHQEIESGEDGTFAAQPLCDGTTRNVRNFVNQFNELPGYGDCMESEQLLTEFSFTVHGHNGRDGNITPASAVARLMCESGWGWHDKSLSDGFGHVIHAWAAVGRPLIGRSRYYRGKLAEPFWQHGITCIDLDVVSLHDAVGMVRAITADPPRHRTMCRAIRAEFDRLVDYEAEAVAVAALLGL